MTEGQSLSVKYESNSTLLNHRQSMSVLRVVCAVERRVVKHLATHVASSWFVGVTRCWDLPQKTISVLGPSGAPRGRGVGAAFLQPNSQNKF